MFLRKILFGALFIASLCSFAAENKVKLISFEPSKIKLWDYWQSYNKDYPSVTLESKWVWPDMVSEYCGKVTFYQYVERTPKMRALSALVLGRNLSCRNWSNGVALLFDTYAENEGKIFISIYNRKSKLYRIDNIAVPKGRKKHRILLDTPMDMSDIESLLIWNVKPSADWTFYLGDIYLEERDGNALKSEYTKTLESISENDFVHLAGKKKAHAVELLKKSFSFLKQFKPGDIAFLKEAIAELKQMKQENDILGQFPDETMIAAWVSPLEKVRRTKQFFANMPRKEFVIDAARGEGEGCQLVILPGKKLSNVCVTLKKTPVDSSGDTIPESAVSVHPVGYVFCKSPKSYVEIPEETWWPDPILHYASKLQLEQDCWQAWYLDLNIPENQKPGLYQGSLQITGYQLPEREVKFEVRVRNFTLEKGEPYFGVYDLGAPTWEKYTYEEPYPVPGEAEGKQMHKELLDLILAHRLNPDAIYTRKKIPSLEEIQYKLANGAGHFNIKYLTCGRGSSEQQKMDASIFLKEIESAVESYKKAGIFDKAYIYGYDEMERSRFPVAQKVAQTIKAKYPGLNLITTAGDPSFGTDGQLSAFDTFCTVIQVYENNMDMVKKARQAGKKVMWYIACGPDAPYPNFFIEFPLMDARLLMGAMFWKYQPDGFLYYSLAKFGKYVVNEDGGQVWIPQGPMMGAPLTGWDPMSFPGFNGDGSLVYPSLRGPVATIRLKAIRDGLDDYMYFKKLADALAEVRSGKKKMSREWCESAGKALIVEDTLVKSLREFTKDPRLLLSKRAELAGLLEEFYAK